MHFWWRVSDYRKDRKEAGMGWGRISQRPGKKKRAAPTHHGPGFNNQAVCRGEGGYEKPQGVEVSLGQWARDRAELW